MAKWFEPKWLLLAVGIAAFPMAFAQLATQPYVPTLTFDVASVRQSPEADSYRVGGAFAPHSSSLVITNFDVMNLLSMAYSLRRDQISGAPDWRTMYNIQAKSDSAADELLAKLNKEQAWLEQQHMLQQLLADRFKLKTHWETRESFAYNLVIVKSGSKLVEAKDGKLSPEEQKAWGDKPLPLLYQRGSSRTGFDFIAHECSISDIVQMLAGQFGQPVFDKTSLTEKYDFILHYHGTRLSERSADDLDPVPPLDTAIQDQLGLKLEKTKGPAQFLVIDHMEKPSEN